MLDFGPAAIQRRTRPLPVSRQLPHHVQAHRVAQRGQHLTERDLLDGWMMENPHARFLARRFPCFQCSTTNRTNPAPPACNPGEGPMTTLFDPIQLGALTVPNRILMAPAHPRPQHHGPCPDPADGRILPSTRRRRAHPVGGDGHQPAGPRLALRARPLEPGADRGVEAHHRSRAPRPAATSSRNSGIWGGWSTPACRAAASP